jgi:nucleotide-binding universal stress UspA family protein
MELAREAGVSATRSIETHGPPARMLLEHARDHDLLALGAPALSRFGGLFVGGVTDDVLKATTSPVLTARGVTGRGRDFARRIIVATDGSPECDRVIELAGRLGRTRRAHVMLLHAGGRESAARPLHVQTQFEMLGAIVRDCELVVEPGSAHEVIDEIADREQASLVVVGTRRRGGLGLGSVSARVVHRAPCSVLVVPPPAG